MSTGVFDLLTVCIGPSSSHTTGPMRAARRFAESLRERGLLRRVASVSVELYGSLASTGAGHGTQSALVLGLEGYRPESVAADQASRRLSQVDSEGALHFLGERTVPFRSSTSIVSHPDIVLPRHPNGLVCRASDGDMATLHEGTYYSVGGGAVVEGDEQHDRARGSAGCSARFSSMQGLLTLCQEERLTISEIMLHEEARRRPAEEVERHLLDLWGVMQECVRRGLRADGLLPGSLGIRRRAPGLHRSLVERPEESLRDPLTALDWVTLYALAVSEENACGGRVVTAPTCGSAGILPAVLHYCMRFRREASEADVIAFLLTAAAIGILFRDNASISGADVGCQGEVGVACSMAAAGLTEVLGGSPAQVEAAAEIGMEHNLGLTCDPVGGLVQVPCVERNAMAAVKAITAARLALRGDGDHLVSLDAVIETMLRTGRDMRTEYKETAQGGLATAVAHVPVNVVDC